MTQPTAGAGLSTTTAFQQRRQAGAVDVRSLVDSLHFGAKVERALALIREAHEEFGDRLVVAKCGGECGIHTRPLRQSATQSPA